MSLTQVKLKPYFLYFKFDLTLELSQSEDAFIENISKEKLALSKILVFVDYLLVILKYK